MGCGLRRGLPAPTDGRYGDNPNRAQHYFQFQVLIKPSPDGIQETYLRSLEALGIKAADHDIRFVKTTGSPPPSALGVWLGGVARWHGGDPVHLLPAVRRPRLQAGVD